MNLQLLAGAGGLLVAIAGGRVSTRFGVPSLLLYIGIGLLLGEDVIGLSFDDARTARDLGLIALAVIVAEGGLTTQWQAVRPVLPAALTLATAGVAVSIAVTAVAAPLPPDVSWRQAALTGAVLRSTDAAAVFSPLRPLSLPRRPVPPPPAEAGVDDA